MSDGLFGDGLDRRDFLRLSGGTLAGAAALGALAACGGDTVGGGSSGGGGSLKFAYWGSAFEQKAIADMLKDFQKQHKDISVTPQYTPYTGYPAKISTQVAAKTPPDVAYLDNVQVYQLAEKGKLVNLKPYLKKYPALADRLPSSYFWLDKDTLIASQLAQGVQLLWFNKKVFDDAGVDTPPTSVDSAWTWDQYLEAAEKLTFDNNGKRPSESGYNSKSVRQFGTTSPIGSGMMYALLRSNGADLFDETGTKYILDSDAAVKVIQDMQDLIWEHRVAPTPSQLGNNAPTTAVQLQTKRIAMLVDGDWTLLDLGQSNIEYGAGVLPKYQKPLTNSGGAAGAVFTDSKNVDSAMELYAFYNDPQYVDLFKDGLWMPLQTKYYTDDKFIADWSGGKIYPDGWKDAAIDATANHSVVWWAQNMKNAAAITSALQPAFDQISANKGSAKDILKSFKSKIEPLLKGRYPTFDI